MVECDSDLIVMFACADKCCDATHGFNWVVDLKSIIPCNFRRRLLTLYRSGNFEVVKIGNYK